MCIETVQAVSHSCRNSRVLTSLKQKSKLKIRTEFQANFFSLLSGGETDTLRERGGRWGGGGGGRNRQTDTDIETVSDRENRQAE